MTAEVTIPVEFKIVKRIYFLKATLFFTRLLSLYILFLVVSQTDGNLQKLLSWYPREPSFTHGRTAKISEKFPSPQGSTSSDQQWRWHVFATTLVLLSLPSGQLIWRWHVYSHRLTYGSCKSFHALRFSILLHSGVHHPNFGPDFHARFPCQSLNVNNEDFVEWTANCIHSRYYQRHCNDIARFNSQKPPH